MKAAKKMALMDAIQQLGSPDGMTTKSIQAFVGVGHRDEKSVTFMFDGFSWNARKLLQLALLVNRHGRRSPVGGVAMLEVAKGLPQLRPAELLAVSVALEHGMEGLRRVKPTVGLLKIK